MAMNYHAPVWMFKLVFELGADPNIKTQGGSNALKGYLMKNFPQEPEIVKLFLTYGFDPSLLTQLDRTSILHLIEEVEKSPMMLLKLELNRTKMTSKQFA